MPAIRKSDVGKLTYDDRACVEKAEVYINFKLIQDYQEGSYVCITYSSLEQLLNKEPNTLVIEKIIEDYREQGWEVEAEHDQREGSWLRFS